MALSASLALIGAAFLAGLGVAFAVSTSLGERITAHRASAFGPIMAGRYFALAALIAIAGLYGGKAGAATGLAALGMLGLWDATVYARSGGTPAPHLIAGLLGLVGAALVWSLA